MRRGAKQKKASDALRLCRGAIAKGIYPRHESNTSRYVHELIRYELRWPFVSIEPQVGRRGPVDYRLRKKGQRRDRGVHVEVKPLGTSLDEAAIWKYLVEKGRPRHGWRVGILTDLEEWHIFIAGPAVTKLSGRALLKLHAIRLSDRNAATRLEYYVGHRRAPGFRNLIAELSFHEDVLHTQLPTAPSVKKAVRAYLRARGHRVPRNAALGKDIRAVLRGRDPTRGTYDFREIRSALCQAEVAKAVHVQAKGLIGCRSNVTEARGAIRRLIGDARGA